MKTLKNTFLLASIGLLASAFVWKAHLSGTYQLDTTKSNLMWSGSKVSGTHIGTLAFSEGSIEMAHGKFVSGKIVVDMTSLACTDIKDKKKNANLVNHLKAEDFFEVENHPTATFTIKSLTPAEKSATNTANNFTATGDLTIKGVTNEVTFPLEFAIGEQEFAAKGKITFDRTKWGVNYGSSLGNAMINDEIELTFGIVGSKGAAKAKATPAKH